MVSEAQEERVESLPVAQNEDGPTLAAADDIASASSRTPKRTRSPTLTDVSDRPSKQSTGAVQTALGRQSSHEQASNRGELSSSNSRMQGRIENFYKNELNDGLREWLLKEGEKDEAEAAAWNAFSEEERRRGSIDKQRRNLIEQSKPQIETVQIGVFQPTEKKFLDKQHMVRYLFQLAPASSRGAGCRCHKCTERIRSGEYRIAVAPGDSGHWAGGPGMSSAGKKRPQ